MCVHICIYNNIHPYLYENTYLFTNSTIYLVLEVCVLREKEKVFRYHKIHKHNDFPILIRATLQHTGLGSLVPCLFPSACALGGIGGKGMKVRERIGGGGKKGRERIGGRREREGVGRGRGRKREDRG